MTSHRGRLAVTLRAFSVVVAAVLAVQDGVAARQERPAGRHDERMAANAAEKFTWALAVSASFAYELLDERARARMPPPEFVEALSRAFPDGPPGKLEATHVAAAGQGLLDLFLTGRSSPDRGYIRMRMAGSAAQGYSVVDFARLSTAPDASARPVPPDNGPFRRYYPLARDSQVVFVPIAADASVVSGLAQTFASRLRLDAKVQAALTPSPAARSAQRGQLVAEVLARELRPRCRELTGTPFVIGVTGEDMYIESYPRWRFAFSYRLEPCVAVVSYFRMQIDGSSELRAARLRKMIAKNLGVLVYGLPLSKDPRSLMFDQILGLGDLDFIEDDLNRGGLAPDDRR